MKFNILLYSFLALLMTSCGSPKAKSFRSAIVEKERIVFKIITDKDGTESQKLEFLIADDYQNAIKTVDRQKMEFDKIIASLDSLDASNIKDGLLLKNSAKNYYTALRDLHYFDRKEIVQRELIFNHRDNETQAEQDKLLNLYKQKKLYFNKVYEKESLLSSALQRFDISNGIK